MTRNDLRIMHRLLLHIPTTGNFKNPIDDLNTLVFIQAEHPDPVACLIRER